MVPVAVSPRGQYGPVMPGQQPADIGLVTTLLTRVQGCDAVQDAQRQLGGVLMCPGG